MRTFKAPISLAAAALLAAAATSATDGPYDITGSEVLEASYDHAAGFEIHAAGYGAYSGLSDCASDGGCVTFPVRPDYRVFDLEVLDETGAVVHAASGTPGIASVCGTTESAHLYQGLDHISFFIFAGTCEDGSTLSLPTSGTVRVTFYASDDPWCMGC